MTCCPAPTVGPTTCWSTGRWWAYLVRRRARPARAAPGSWSSATSIKERPMLEIAGEPGVTESRVSQLRAEALILLR